MEWLNILRGAVLVVAPIGFLFQRDLPFTYLISVDNTTWFIAYWLFIPMAIWFAIEKFEEDSPSSISSKLKGGRTREQMDESRKKNISEREYAVQKEREFVKNEVRKTNLRSVTWEDKSLPIGRKPIQSYVLGDKPSDYWFGINKINKSNFNTFMSMKSKNYNELRLNPIGIVNQYEKWLLTSEGKLYSRKRNLSGQRYTKRSGLKGNLDSTKKEIKSTVKPEKEKTPITKTKETTEDKLKKLKDLYDKELISKEVYEKQQLEILSK